MQEGEGNWDLLLFSLLKYGGSCIYSSRVLNLTFIHFTPCTIPESKKLAQANPFIRVVLETILYRVPLMCWDVL
jgi:hypothetical protein